MTRSSTRKGTILLPFEDVEVTVELRSDCRCKRTSLSISLDSLVGLCFRVMISLSGTTSAEAAAVVSSSTTMSSTPTSS